MRIMTWNVRSWDEFSHEKNWAVQTIGCRCWNWWQKQNADMLCFQEFFEPADTAKSNIRYIRNQLGVPLFFLFKGLS